MNNISFSGLYTEYYKRSFLFVKSYVRDDRVAEDIASEALIQLWETLKTETVNTPLALLTTILKNRAELPEASGHRMGGDGKYLR